MASSSSNTAFVVLSDPHAGEEALGRLFNALAGAYDFDRAGHDVQVLFQGAGTRWPAVLDKPDHAAAQLYQAVRHTVTGVSCGCADVFGAREGIAASGLDLITNNPVPGTSGLASLRALADEGYSILTF